MGSSWIGAFFVILAVIFTCMAAYCRLSKEWFKVMLLLSAFCFFAAFFCNILIKDKTVIVLLTKIENGYHLKCDDNVALQKIAEVFPEIPEEELAKMDFESLSLQKSVDWKVNAFAKSLEKEYGKGAEFRAYVPGFKRLERVSKEEVERVINEYVTSIKK